MSRILFMPTYYFEHVPPSIRDDVLMDFVEHLGEVIDVYNSRLKDVNEKWYQTGKPAMFGDLDEDVNPEYVDLIRNIIQPEIDMLNDKFPNCKYRINDIGGIEGYLPWIRNSKIYYTLKRI